LILDFGLKGAAQKRGADQSKIRDLKPKITRRPAADINERHAQKQRAFMRGERDFVSAKIEHGGHLAKPMPNAELVRKGFFLQGKTMRHAAFATKFRRKNLRISRHAGVLCAARNERSITFSKTAQ